MRAMASFILGCSLLLFHFYLQNAALYYYLLVVASLSEVESGDHVNMSHRHEPRYAFGSGQYASTPPFRTGLTAEERSFICEWNRTIDSSNAWSILAVASGSFNTA